MEIDGDQYLVVVYGSEPSQRTFTTVTKITTELQQSTKTFNDDNARTFLFNTKPTINQTLIVHSCSLLIQRTFRVDT